MEKVQNYILGIVTGILLTLVYFAVKNYLANQGTGNGEKLEQHEGHTRGATMFDNPVPFIEARTFKIDKVLFRNAALATCDSGGNFFIGTEVLIRSDRENSFYDNQVVSAPNNCNVMQVGTYKYLGRTVPIIRFMKK